MDPLTNNQYPTFSPQDQAISSNNPPAQQGYPNLNSASYPQFSNYQQYPQYPQHPQYAQYPQYPPQQYVPINPVQPGYVPPNQYVILPEQEVPNTSQANTLKRIRELELTLDNGCFKCYVVWLYFLTVIACLGLIQIFIGLFTYNEVGGFIVGIVAGFWIIWQSILEISAINTRNLNKANRAVILMTIYAILNLAAIITFALLYSDLERRYRYRDYYGEYDGYIVRVAFLIYLVLFSCYLLCHICFTLVGAVKVRNILRERKNLQDSIRPSY